jgi:hypothetical protein
MTKGTIMTTHLDIEKERISCAAEFGAAWERQSADKQMLILGGWLAARSASLPPVAAPVSQQDAGAPDFCPECHLQASMPDREEMAIVGRKLANWLFGLSVAQAMPDVWRKTCAELVAAWNVVAGEPAPAGSAKGGNTHPETAARASLQADEGKDGEATDAMVDAGAEVLYGYPREKAIEWVKEDKFDSCADQARNVYSAMRAAIAAKEGK